MTDKNTPPSRGTLTDFDGLHGALTATYVEALRRYKKAKETPPPQFLAALQRFLSENGVDVPAQDKRWDRLKDALPNMDALEQSGNIVPITRSVS